MGFLTGITGKIAGVTSILLAIALGWGFRVDHLRAGYKERLDTIRIVLKDIGENPKTSNEAMAAVIAKVGAQRKMYQVERDNARATVDIQNASISAMQSESEQAAERAAQNRKLIETVTKQRDMWIQRAKSAETRTARLSAQEELNECQRVLNDLYQSGF